MKFMPLPQKFWQISAGISGFCAVVMGAVAAHAIKDAHLAAMAEKASYYQLAHSILLMFLAGRGGQLNALARFFFLAGILFFCGSLYIRAVADIGSITQLAPLGGMSFMAGWLLLAFGQKS